MSRLNALIESYRTYHNNQTNIRYHFVGVPLVTFGLFLFLSWFRFVVPSVPLTGAVLFYLSVLIYYAWLDSTYAWQQAIVTLPLLYLADRAALLPFASSASLFVLTFGGGWVLQLLGHHHEGKKPAFLDNVGQILVAPLFLTYELKSLGRR